MTSNAAAVARPAGLLRQEVPALRAHGPAVTSVRAMHEAYASGDIARLTTDDVSVGPGAGHEAVSDAYACIAHRQTERVDIDQAGRPHHHRHC
jgi:hypothetical protein